MCEITIRLEGEDQAIVNINWFDPDNISQNTKIELITYNDIKTASLEIRLNNEIVATIEAQ